ERRPRDVFRLEQEHARRSDADVIPVPSALRDVMNRVPTGTEPTENCGGLLLAGCRAEAQELRADTPVFADLLPPSTVELGLSRGACDREVFGWSAHSLIQAMPIATVNHLVEA